MNPGTLRLKQELIDLASVSPMDLDRKTQQEMVTQPPIDKWFVFYSQRDQDAYRFLETELIACFDQTNYRYQAPQIVEVTSNLKDAWLSTVEDNIKREQGVKLVVLILSGR